MAKVTKPIKGPGAAAPVKKVYLIRDEDVERLVFSLDGKILSPAEVEDAHRLTATRERLVIERIELKRGGRVVQIDDSADGRSVLTSNIRRIVGNKIATRLISGAIKSTKTTDA